MQAAFWAQTIKNQNLGQLWKALKDHCTINIHQDLILCANINKPIGFTGTQTGFILTYRPKNCFKMSCDLLLASVGVVHLFYLPVHPGAQGIREWGEWKALVQGRDERTVCGGFSVHGGEIFSSALGVRRDGRKAFCLDKGNTSKHSRIKTSPLAP